MSTGGGANQEVGKRIFCTKLRSNFLRTTRLQFCTRSGKQHLQRSVENFTNLKFTRFEKCDQKPFAKQDTGKQKEKPTQSYYCSTCTNTLYDRHLKSLLDVRTTPQILRDDLMLQVCTGATKMRSLSEALRGEVHLNTPYTVYTPQSQHEYPVKQLISSFIIISGLSLLIVL